MSWSGEATAARGRRVLALLLVLGLGVLAGCTNTPPPPLVTPAPTTSSPPPKQESLNEVVVGVDQVSGGYNPHTLADESTVTTALSSLLLPSVFRPGSDGNPVLDRSLMDSAEVSSAEPFTVTYAIKREATWSDSAPIAAEDFVYLWQRMRAEPGTVDPAGYRLISDISSREGGKIVVVTFAKPYPGWRSLFANLLPAHLLKDAPGGWANALADGFPAVGGPFAVRTLDRGRGEIVLERNDRYWGRAVVPERVTLRRASQPEVVTALGTGDNQVAVLRADAITTRLLADLTTAAQSTTASSSGPAGPTSPTGTTGTGPTGTGATGTDPAGADPAGTDPAGPSSGAPTSTRPATPPTTATVPRPEVAQLLLRPASPRLADVRVRAAVAAALDRDALIAVGTGSGPSAQLRADAQVLLPSRPGYAATLPAGAPPAAPDPARTEQLLGESGFTRQDDTWTRQDTPLKLVVAAPAESAQYVSIAGQVQRQLTQAGIQVELRTPPGKQLYEQLQGEQAPEVAPSSTPARPTGDAGTEPPSRTGDADAVDIAVVPRLDNGDPAATLADTFGCASALPDGTTAVPANLAGFCDRALQPAIDAALTGQRPLADVLAELEPALWQQFVAIPLFQVADTLAVLPDEVSGVSEGAPLAGVFSTATQWRRQGR
ncbi:ABC-type transport system, substrate-binding protein [Goodfellowiella coeruleoviolacea]|uniref:ABC-type transport system, substrate-binding protein n=2 Tax=Goodfellowiella coeruleoviolacea TaxID=334858 RepID=A0AAE3KGN9_9PSEU|nr:ABC-type transport system, substrate-binding protein [Goodfellowiella coeruleoviolacea]